MQKIFSYKMKMNTLKLGRKFITNLFLKILTLNLILIRLQKTSSNNRTSSKIKEIIRSWKINYNNRNSNKINSIIRLYKTNTNHWAINKNIYNSKIDLKILKITPQLINYKISNNKLQKHKIEFYSPFYQKANLKFKIS